MTQEQINEIRTCHDQLDGLIFEIEKNLQMIKGVANSLWHLLPEEEQTK